MEGLTDEDRRALRGSKFAPLPSLSTRPSSRLAHPGGPVTTNKAVALAKFLERKLQNPNGLASINPDLLELAVKNAKDTVNANNYSSLSGTSKSGRTVRHVTSFGESENPLKEEEVENSELKKRKKKKKKKEKKRNKKQKVTAEDLGNAILKRPKKKLKL